ncbi:uncharacterized protein Tco025E_01937 [Trypanosoma conorhini]|uniref:Uncharacterized protein n=1 Tax=Trypanosoma conorhini TaxID=83891 RepID=A0A3R7NYH9_9TRYP|nr:uncharacterized protein Tco025E_01937 [Trypanosoma conorhini]RNF25837.1 hypothetical protein Tco025E_01937 [Trypanosoma conorhini]
MAGVADSLLQLQRLIARAGNEGGADGGSGEEHASETSDGISVRELERRFAGLETELFRQHGLREQARELHQRAERRRRQRQRRQGLRGAWESGTAPEEEAENASYAATAVGGAAAGGARRASSSPGSSALNGSASPLRQEVSAHDVRRRIDGRCVAETETAPRACHPADPDAHLLVDVTDGSARLQGIGVGDSAGGREAVLGSGSGRCAPSFSFAQAYAEDDRQRLLFIVDQLSYILREERRQKEVLLQRVVDPLVRQIEALGRALARQRRENAALRREAERCIDPRRTLRPGGVTRSGKTDSGDDRVLMLLQCCEEQIRRLTELQLPQK